MAPEGRSIPEVACASSTVKKTKKFIAKPPQNCKSLAQRAIHWRITASPYLQMHTQPFQGWGRNKPLDMLILTVRLECNRGVLEYELLLDTAFHNNYCILWETCMGTHSQMDQVICVTDDSTPQGWNNFNTSDQR